ncbi:MAG: DUF177 domain-containing protein [Clostridia bacterium]|nr:DUF177 domain-containing protein [Clostridia bacterium]
MIPKIDVRSLVARKRYTGELAFEYEAESSLVDIPFAEFSAPVRIELGYEIFEDDKVEAKGRVLFSLRGSCSRCLAETERQIEEEIYAIFEPNGGDGENYGYFGGVIDLSEFVRDSVAFALPSKLLCGECSVPDGENE